MRRLILFLMLVVMPSITIADTYYLEPPTTVGTDDSNAATIAELIRISFSDVAKSKDQLVDNIEEADYILRPKIVNLEGAYIVSLEKLKHNKVLYSSRVKSYKISEMDVKVLQLVRGLLSEKSPEVNVGEVTKKESKEEAYRKKVVDRWEFAFGPGYGVNLNTDDMMVSVLLGRSWEVNPSASIRMFWEGNWTKDKSDKAYFTNAGLGLNYFLTTGDSAPFVQCDLGYGVAGAIDDHDWEGDKTMNGFVLGVGCGYSFFRTSLANFEILLRYQALLDSNDEGLPGNVSLKVGVLF